MDLEVGHGWVFSTLMLLITLLSVVGTHAALPSPDDLKPILKNISDWILRETDLPSNNITNARDTLRTSIFINGNLARTLLASSQIFSDKDYLNAGLQWCDTLVTLQNNEPTHDGRDAGGWWDTGYRSVKGTK